MAKDNEESPKEQHQTATEKIIVDSGNHTANDKGKVDDAHAWHKALYGGEGFATAEEIVESATYADRDNGDNEDIGEHTDSVNLDDFASCELHHKGGHHRSAQGGSTSHPDGECYVCMA